MQISQPQLQTQVFNCIVIVALRQQQMQIQMTRKYK